jgi:hypothetical protein
MSSSEVKNLKNCEYDIKLIICDSVGLKPL